MSWYKITLTENAVGLGAFERVHDAFSKKMLEYVGAKEMAVFDCKNEDATETVLYISPKMALVSPREISDFSAVESSPPTGEEPEFDVLVSADDVSALSLIRS